MPLLTDDDRTTAFATAVAADDGAGRPGRRKARLEIGLVNLMPDAAVRSTERQFRRLLTIAACEFDVRLHLFTLEGIPRSAEARSEVGKRYRDLDSLKAMKLDGLIVTGTEPVADDLTDEPYWTDLARLIDWAERNTASTIFSCLAAHAAVLHLDGIARRRLDRKRFGLFPCASLRPGGLLGGLTSSVPVPHSRWNDLEEGALRSHGYQICSRSVEAGVDLFTKSWGSRFVFLQGHPEYRADTLAREYRRDMERYLTGRRETLPGLPVHYFDRGTESALATFTEAAARGRDPALWDRFPAELIHRAEPVQSSRSGAETLWKNWLSTMADRPG